MKEYNGGTVTRKAVHGKQNEYKSLKFLVARTGTAVYKSSFILFYCYVYMYTNFEIIYLKFKS